MASLLAITLALMVAVAAWAISRQPNVLPPETLPSPPTLSAERSEAAAELLSSFNAWRNGDAQRAATLFETATSLSPPLATTVAARWFERRIHGEDAILFQTAAESPLYSLATTTDGSLAAVAGADGTVALLPLAITSADDETPPLTILDIGEGINNAVFGPDGRQLAVVGEAGGLTVWDVESGREQHRSTWGKSLYGLAISPDGEWIVSGGEESVVRVAPLADPADVVHTFDLAAVRIGDAQKADSEIESITFVDDTRVAIAFGHQLIAFDTATGQLLRSVEAEAVLAVIDRVRASPAGDLVLTTAAHRGTPKLWSTTTWDVVAVLPEHAERVRDAAFSPDGGQIATAGKDGVIRVFDAETLIETRRLVGHRGSVWKLSFLGANGLISAGDDGTARRWNLDRDPTQPPGIHLFPPLNADGQPFAGDLRQITACTVCQLPGLTPAVAALDTKARLHLFNLATGFWRPPFFELGSLSTRLNGVTALASGDQVAVSLNDTPFALVTTNATTTPRVQRFDEVDSKNCVLCGCGDGLVAFTSSDQTLHLLDTRDGRLVELERSLHDVGCRALAAASQPPLRLLAADHDRIRIYTLTPAGDRLAPDRDLPSGAIDARAAAWSPDDATIACGAADGSVWIYDAAGLKPPRLITTHWNEVRGLAFDASGHTLVSCDAESIRFHDPDARVTFDEFTPGWEITGLALSPDEASLIICGSEGLCTLDLNVPPPLHIGVK